MFRKLLEGLPTSPYECLCQGCERPWEVAIDPFQVAPDTYFVGNIWVGAYLLKTTEGLVLIDTTMQPQIYLLLESIRKLGFDPRDIRLILISHMHYDHIGGARAMVEATGAKLMMSREDWAFMQSRPDQVFDCGYPFGSVTPDAFYDESPIIKLGDREIRTELTPGHTPGTTSFFFKAGEHLCGLHGGIGLNTLTDEGLKTSGQPVTARQDFLNSLQRVREIPVDIALGSHPGQVEMIEKLDDIPTDINRFVDPQIWRNLMDERIARVQALMGEGS